VIVFGGSSTVVLKIVRIELSKKNSKRFAGSSTVFVKSVRSERGTKAIVMASGTETTEKG
jgi:hypothetical protein